MTKEFIDELTGLYNRKGLINHITEYAGRDKVNVLYMDLDNFKTVNDLYGHGEGDKVLQAFGTLVRELFHESFPIRMGGDEFVVIFKGEKSRKELNAVIDVLSERVQNNRTASIGFSVISVSVGVLRNISVTRENLSEMLQHADLALYAAKNQGKACYVYYEDISKELINRKAIEKQAEEAILQDAFEIKYQPVVHLQTAEIVSVDMRFMWKKDGNDYWEIREYRDIFEQNGFIRRFDIYMFEKACKEISELKKHLKTAVPFNIILSRLSFLSPKIGQELLEVMKC